VTNSQDITLKGLKGSSVSMASTKTIRPKVAFQASWKTEFVNLLYRNVLTVARDVSTIKAVVISAAISSIVMCILISGGGNDPSGVQTKIGTIFGICIYVMMRSMNPMVPIFHSEKLISRKERASNSYRVLTAFFSKWFAQLPVTLAGNMIFVVPLYWIGSMNPKAGKFFAFIMIILLESLAASSVGIWVAAKSRNVTVGMIITPLLSILASLFSGDIVNFARMPGFMVWMRWISPIGNAISALSINVFSGFKTYCPKGAKVCFADGEGLLSTFQFDSAPLWNYVGYNAAITAFFIFFAIRAFDKQSRPQIRLG
jgi:hypothetical protein